MIIVKAIKSKSVDENGKSIDILYPEFPLPVGYKVRFIDGVFQCVEQGEEWPE